MRQGSAGRILLRGPKASSDTGAIDPHKMPSRLTNDGIEDRCRDLLNHRPVIANRLLKRLQMIRKNAILAQENGMRPHAWTLFDVAGVRELTGMAVCFAEGSTGVSGECSSKKSSANIAGSSLDRSGLIEPAPVSEVPVASGTLADSPR